MSYTPTATIPTITLSGTRGEPYTLSGMDGCDMSLNSQFPGMTNEATLSASSTSPSCSSSRFPSVCSSTPFTPRRTVRKAKRPSLNSLDPITGILQVWYQNLLAESVFFLTEDTPTAYKRLGNIMSIFKVSSAYTSSLSASFSQGTNRVMIGRSTDCSSLSASTQDRLIASRHFEGTADWRAQYSRLSPR